MSEPIYPRLLGLRHIHPNAWQRALLGEGMVVAGVLLSLADLASAWSIVVLPVATGGVVKAHDLVTGLVGRRPADVAPATEPAGPPTSRELWEMVEGARELARDGGLPFVLVAGPQGPIRVGADVGGLLTAEEQAAALRAGVESARPERAVLVYASKDGVQLAAYEAGLGALVADDLTVLTAELPPLLPESEKAPTP